MAAIGEKMARALNEQVRAELYSSYLYLAMSAHFSATNLPGFANWMRVQAQEELMHGMKIYDFVIARGGRAELLAIEKPPFEWASGSREVISWTSIAQSCTVPLSLPFAKSNLRFAGSLRRNNCPGALEPINR